MLSGKAEMVGFFLLTGGSNQLVGNQMARLSSLGVVILSEVLSPDIDLNSSAVRNVLRGWIAHGDIAAVWMTQPRTSSTAASVRCQWMCVLLAYRSGNVLRCSLSMFRCTGNWLDSFYCKAHRQLGACFKDRFLHRTHRVRYAIFVARALVHSFHAKDSWTNKQRWVG